MMFSLQLTCAFLLTTCKDASTSQSTTRVAIGTRDKHWLPNEPADVERILLQPVASCSFTLLMKGSRVRITRQTQSTLELSTLSGSLQSQVVRFCDLRETNFVGFSL